MSISDLYSTGFRERNRDHFAAIVRVALSDGAISLDEKAFLDRLAKNLDVSVNTKLLKKNKYSKQQSKLKASQRSKNLNGSYKCNPQKNIDFKSHIYLVDDIVSSASTLEECALILKKS